MTSFSLKSGLSGAALLLLSTVAVQTACTNGDFGEAWADDDGGAQPPAPVDASADAGDFVEDMRVARTLPQKLAYHQVRQDAAGKLLAAFDGPGMYATVSRIGWEAMARVPVLDNGYPTYFTHSVFVSNPGRELGPPVPDPAPHCRAGFVTMMIDSALAWYAYSGDAKVLEMTRAYVEFVIERSLTESTDAWSKVPYASANSHEIEAHGANLGDGDGNLEIDKIAEMALGLVRFYEHTGDTKFLEVAVQSARELAKHVRTGDERHSPWPYRVDAKTGTQIKEEYTAHVIPAIALFDELALLGRSEAGFAEARAKAWDWLLAWPMKNNGWQGYFEDIATRTDPWANTTQYISLETARWMMLHPDKDPDSLTHARALIDWTAKVLGADGPPQAGFDNSGMQYGAEAISEQEAYAIKMGSHTSRFGSVLALYYAKTGDRAIRERAFRSLNWSTYLSSSTGVVSDFPREIPPDPIYSWFTDGYGDYIRHFMAAMQAIPAWAPPTEDHLLGTSSIVKNVTYSAEGIRWTTFHAAADDVLRLRRAPSVVKIGDTVLGTDERAADHFTVRDIANGGVSVRVHRSGAISGEVAVLR